MAAIQVKSSRQTQILQRKPAEFLEKKSNTIKNDEKRIREVPYLNDDIMWHIFNRVPAISLWENCRFLCKQWYNMICNQNFLKAHFLLSKHGILLIEDLEREGKNIKVMKCMEFKETEIGEVHNLHTLKEKEFIESNCAGLYIVTDISSGNTRVMNPVTKESIQIPCLTKKDMWREIVFDRADMNYKIAVFTPKFNDFGERMPFRLTLRGLDGTCKKIKGPINFWLGDPVLINGVLYCNAEEKGLWCFDLSIETFCFLRWPINVECVYCFQILDVGGFVGFVAIDVEINIWILRKQKWVQRCSIGKEQPLPYEPGLYPRLVGCLGSDELFVFTKNWSRLEAYNVKTKEWMMITPVDNNRCDRIHVNNILPLTTKMVS